MKQLLATLLFVASALSTRAALQPGDSLTPYEIKNTRTGATYCQVCAYGAKPGKIVAFGKIDDAAFWGDLEQLQKYAATYPGLGVFAQVIDSKDAAAIQAAATKHGIKFPVVVAVEKDWDKAYQVQGVSRTIYYAVKNNKINWTTVGLEADAAKKLSEKLSVDLAG